MEIINDNYLTFVKKFYYNNPNIDNIYTIIAKVIRVFYKNYFPIRLDVEVYMTINF